MWESDSSLPRPAPAPANLPPSSWSTPPPAPLQPLELLTMIHKPGHAQGVEFLIKKLHPLQEKRR